MSFQSFSVNLRPKAIVDIRQNLNQMAQTRIIKHNK